MFIFETILNLLNGERIMNLFKFENCSYLKKVWIVKKYAQLFYHIWRKGKNY
jgi:hypothetical protein